MKSLADVTRGGAGLVGNFVDSLFFFLFALGRRHVPDLNGGTEDRRARVGTPVTRSGEGG